MVLLDTCALLWLVSDQAKLSSKAKELIKSESDGICVSAISAFEIAIKSRQKKLILPMKSDKWFKEAIEFHSIKEVPITSSIATNSVTLPVMHNDPCDRFVIATAKEYKLPIITCDKLISQYPNVKVIW